MRLWRLGTAGRRVADALERGQPPPAGHEPLTRRLVAAGAVHPPSASVEGAWVAVVIPTLDPEPEALQRLVDQVRREVGTTAPVIVVDDASTTTVTAPTGAVVVRTAHRSGPAGARNLGVAQVDTPYVVFVDDDVDLPEGWLAPLLGHVADPAVAAAAPRVAGPAAGTARTWWERAEQVRSPLDLGSEPAPVRPGSRVPYVPSAVLMVRRDAFGAVRGFDPTLRFGEDVDLVWRLHGAGLAVRYEPRSVVHHRARRTAWAGLVQRYRYGTSAAPLGLRHRHAIAAARASRTSLAAWLLVLVGRPVSAAAALAATTRSAFGLRCLLRDRGVEDAGRWALRWTVRGQWSTVRQLAAAMWRVWWPMAAVAAASGRRGRRIASVATGVVVMDDLMWWARSPAVDPVRFLVYARMGDLAYGAGLWRGMWRHRTGAPLRIDVGTPDRVSEP